MRTDGLRLRERDRPPPAWTRSPPGMRCARHRGPDEPGTWDDDDVVFGFNRLSIIDIEHSHQPLRWGPPEHPDRYALVFNGEIYNYLELRAELAAEHGATFATEGDGEAIVAAYHHWGQEAVARLRGMFAFLIWDTAGAGAVRRARPVRHQAAVRRRDRRTGWRSPPRRRACAS